jgi:putative alpha-1,2-mannosidase
LRNNWDFTIRCKNFRADRFYMVKATLNGEPLNRAWIMADELMTGGVIDMEMSEHPSPWDREPPLSALILIHAG